jgi:2-desacetyl-2-hydroxyethyl bacteriochlorophyllide A dehydrogenase
MISCGACDLCRRGDPALCRRLEHIGVARSGGFAELCLAPAENLFRLPAEVGYEEAALLDCTAVAVHAVRRVPLPAGAHAVVLGAGAIGQAAAQLARLAGARVTVVGTRPGPLEVARALGADETVDLGAGELPPEGADVVFETAGGAGQIARALAAAGPGGSIGIVGESFEPEAIDPAAAMPRELTIAFVWSHDGRSEYLRALALTASGQVTLAPIVTHRYPLAELPAAFEAASDRAGSGAIKVMVSP